MQTPRFPENMDSPGIVYAEDLYGPWMEHKHIAWRAQLGFLPSPEMEAQFLQQCSHDFNVWFASSFRKHNEASQKAWQTHLSQRWAELRASLGTEPVLTPEQHVEWRRAQHESFERATQSRINAIRDFGASVAGTISNDPRLSISGSVAKALIETAGGIAQEKLKPADMARAAGELFGVAQTKRHAKQRSKAERKEAAAERERAAAAQKRLEWEQDAPKRQEALMKRMAEAAEEAANANVVAARYASYDVPWYKR